jgi:hypothetical protein
MFYFIIKRFIILRINKFVSKTKQAKKAHELFQESQWARIKLLQYFLWAEPFLKKKKTFGELQFLFNFSRMQGSTLLILG